MTKQKKTLPSSNGVGRGQATKQETKIQPNLQEENEVLLESIELSIKNNTAQSGVIYSMNELNNTGWIRPTISKRSVIKFYFTDVRQQELGKIRPGTVVSYVARSSVVQKIPRT